MKGSYKYIKEKENRKYERKMNTFLAQQYRITHRGALGMHRRPERLGGLLVMTTSNARVPPEARERCVRGLNCQPEQFNHRECSPASRIRWNVDGVTRGTVKI